MKETKRRERTKTASSPITVEEYPGPPSPLNCPENVAYSEFARKHREAYEKRQLARVVAKLAEKAPALLQRYGIEPTDPDRWDKLEKKAPAALKIRLPGQNSTTTLWQAETYALLWFDAERYRGHGDSDMAVCRTLLKIPFWQNLLMHQGQGRNKGPQSAKAKNLALHLSAARKNPYVIFYLNLRRAAAENGLDLRGVGEAYFACAAKSLFGKTCLSYSRRKPLRLRHALVDHVEDNESLLRPLNTH